MNSGTCHRNIEVGKGSGSTRDRQPKVGEFGISG